MSINHFFARFVLLTFSLVIVVAEGLIFHVGA
jgi:hypothetical protein